MKRKRTSISWKRRPSYCSSPRLVRLPDLVPMKVSQETNFISNSDELQMCELSDSDKRVANEMVIQSLIVQHHIKGKHVVFRNKIRQDSSLLTNISKDILIMIIDRLSLGDIKTLAETCKFLSEFVNRYYIESVVLPLSEKNLRRLSGRAVLKISSSFSLDLLNDHETFYMKMINQINLNKLKVLRFNGRQCKYFVRRNNKNNSAKVSEFGVSPDYIKILDFYLSKTSQLQFLDMLIDRSEKMAKTIKYISCNFLNLKEITLRSMYYGTSSSSTAVPVKIIYNSDPNWDLNTLIASLIDNLPIEHLTLKGVMTGTIWLSNAECDKLSRIYDSCAFKLRIESKWLKKFYLQETKCCWIESICCPNLVEIEVEDFACLCSHHGIRSDESAHNLARQLSSGCPKLERFNDKNIKLLRRDYHGNWLKAVLPDLKYGKLLPCQLCHNKKYFLREYEGLYYSQFFD